MLYRIVSTLSVAFILALIPLGCLPAPEFKVRLDGVWLFHQDPEKHGIDQMWYAPEADRRLWQVVRLPSNWESLQGMDSYNGWGWYARMVVLPESVPPLSLYFAGVDDDAVVWINGLRVSEHTGYSEPFSIDVSGVLRPGENTLVVLVNDNEGPGGIVAPVTLVESAHLEDVMRSPYAAMPARESAPWVRDAVIYSAYLRSSSPEGTFDGLRKRIPELRRMGVSVLWLLPVHPVGEVKRKGTLGSPFAVRDFYGVNPEYGTLEDFRTLLRSAHEEGMHVILDLVANHTAWDNKLLQEHPGWYVRDATGAVVPPSPEYADVADLDYSQPGLRRYMIEMMRWWVGEIGIDGFRCDVAELVPLDFWEEARRHLDAIRPVMMLAEGALPEYHLAAFDLTYDWNLYNMLQPLLAGDEPARRLHRALEAEGRQFPRGSLRLRFTTNHDKNYWDAPAVEKFGRNGLRLGTVLAFTLPGIPLIYTGEEVANDRRLSLFEKVDVDWSRSGEMGEIFRELALLRQAHPALRSGDCQVVAASVGEVVAFSRGLGSDQVLVALNVASRARDVTLRAPHLANTTLQEHGSGRTVVVDGDGVLSFVLDAQAQTILLARP